MSEHEAAQQELLRQRYLRQLGLIPWIARQPLPQAAALPLLPLPPRRSAAPHSLPHDLGVMADGAATQAPVEQSAAKQAPVTGGFAARALATPPAPRTEQQLSTDRAAQPLPEIEQRAVADAEAAAPSLIYTLQAYAGERVHLWVEQQRADAPALSRDEGQLLQALLRALAVPAGAAPRRLTCAPTAGQPPSVEDARHMLITFARGLLGREQGAKVLLCVSQATATALFQAPRYQPQTLAGVHFLPVSALAEMLADPLNHKRATWQAMLAHDFR